MIKYVRMIVLLSLSLAVPFSLLADNTENLGKELDSTMMELSAMSPEQMKQAKAGEEPSSFDHFMERMRKNMMEKLLKDNPLSHMDKSQVRDFIVERAQGTGWQKVFDSSPNTLNFVVDWLSHPQALPKIVNLLGEKKKLKTYFWCFIGIFIFSILLNAYLGRKAGFFKRLFIKLFVSVFSFVAQLGVFYYLFHEQLDPTVGLIKLHYF